MTAYRLGGRNGLNPSELADLLALKSCDTTEATIEPSHQWEANIFDCLGLVWAFGVDSLIELIEARLEEEDESSNDVSIENAADIFNQASRALN
jgi:hypothetical protein